MVKILDSLSMAASPEVLAAGRGAELDSFVHELALKVYPLVKYCDDQFTAEDVEKFELAVTQKLATLEPPPA